MALTRPKLDNVTSAEKSKHGLAGLAGLAREGKEDVAAISFETPNHPMDFPLVV